MKGLRSYVDAFVTVVMLVAAAALIGVVLRGTESKKPTAKLTKPPPSDPVSLAGAPTRGNPDARAVLIIYSDFQCPFCRRFATETLPQIDSEFVNRGELLLAFRHFPLLNIHPLAQGAAEAAECARRQGRFWAMHDDLFANPSALDVASIRTRAPSLGLSRDVFERCVDGEATESIRNEVVADLKLGLSGTPTLFVGVRRSDGLVQVAERISGAVPFSELEPAIRKQLQYGPSTGADEQAR